MRDLEIVEQQEPSGTDGNFAFVLGEVEAMASEELAFRAEVRELHAAEEVGLELHARQYRI